MIALLAALAGCGGPAVPDCTDPAAVVASVDEAELSCAVAVRPIHWIELLAARDLSPGDRRLVLQEVRTLWTADPAGTTAWLDEVQAAGAALEVLGGQRGAEKRSTQVYEAVAGAGVITSAHAGLWNIQTRALSVWTRSERERLAMTETDIEAWINYASLCREVQNGGPLRISVADRVTVYRLVEDRFDTGDRNRQVAMIAIGPFWGQVREGWQMASYARQQAWIKEAPLPPPMTATSMGYMEALLLGDVPGHVQVLHEKLGPFTMNRRSRVFAGERQ